MRAIHKIRTRDNRRYRRHLRVRRKVTGSGERPRLVVFRSSKHIYAQVVDDTRGVTLVGAADRTEGIQVEGKGKTARSSPPTRAGRACRSDMRPCGVDTIAMPRPFFTRGISRDFT